MADYGFDLRQRTRNKSKKKMRGLIILFICFIIILGTFSLLWFWRSLNYDFNNVFSRDGETTQVQTTTSPDSVTYSGKYHFLIAITSDDGKESYIFNAITVDLSDKTIRVIPVDGNITDSESGLNCHQLLVTNGIGAVGTFLDGYYGITFDKYLVITETQYKSLFRMMGDITVNLDEEVIYDTDNMFLEIPAEKDYVLTSDKTHKYMKYIYETMDGYERSEAHAEIIVSAFNAFYNTKNCEKGEALFSAIINCFSSQNISDKNISIVDYNDAQDEIAYLLPKNSNEKLKVFVSDNIKADSVEEVSS